MHHRSLVEMVDADRSPDEILTRIPASPHTLLPVFRDSDENILGVIHAKDLLREASRPVRRPQGNAKALADPDILKIAMKPRFVPDTTH
jgi:Mg2+/Co2+ transporter CorB